MTTSTSSPFISFFSWLFKLVTKLVIFIVLVPILISFTYQLLSNKNQIVDYNNSDVKVAVVELIGPIISAKDILEQLHEHVEDKSITAIVLRIDSPGGAVAPSQEIYEAVKTLKSQKPIVASMGSVAASGGLYSALAADKIILQPGTQTGSIGVIVQIPNFTEVSKKIGVEFLTIKSGKLKDIGNPTRPISEQDRTFLQTTVDKIYQQFLHAVADSRHLELKKVKKFADGRLILGSEAVELGLADDFGDVYHSSRIAAELAGKTLNDQQHPTLIYSNNKLSEFKRLLKGSSNFLKNLLYGNNVSYPEFFYY